MFGFFNRPKPIPASDCERAALIRELLRKRVADDPMAQMMAMVCDTNVEQMTDLALFTMPEASILRVVEHYLTMKRQGVSDSQAFAFLHQTYSAGLAQAGVDLGPCPYQADLSRYVRFFVRAMHGHGSEIADEFISHAIQRILAYYS